MLSYETIKKVLFKFQPETSHNIVYFFLKTLGNFSFLRNKLEKHNFVSNLILHQKIFDLDFSNPVGLAAGFDKNGNLIKSVKSLGFGFSEIGTVTLRPQEGNSKPRMFRYIKEKSIQNAMGFNNAGSHAILKNLKKSLPFEIPIGVNIGKNKSTPEEFALSDYKHLIKKFKDIADYLVINISSPNTPNLRDLQNEDFISKIFSMAKKITKKPILLKVAPDMDTKVAIRLCKTAIKSGASGIIATNTTIDYTLIENSKDFGGLSGDCLREKSSKFFKELAKELFGKTVLISVGGISNAKEAYERIKNGASLVQIYSGLVFEGPQLINDINHEIINMLEFDGFEGIEQAIGANLKR